MERTQVNKKLTSAKLIQVLTYCILPLLVSVGLLTSSQFLITHGINSDLLYTVSLYRDLLVDHYKIFGWNITPAPYFFPDMVLLFPLLWIIPDIGYAFAAYYVISFILWLVILTRIALFLNRNLFTCFSCVFAAGLLFVAFIQNVNYVLITEYLLPSAHAGVILVGFTLIAMSLNAVQKGYSYGSGILFFLLSFLIIISDLLIVPQFLLPLVVTSFIFYRLHFIPRRTFRFTAGLTVGAYLVASVVTTLIKFTRIFHIPTQGYIHTGSFFDTGFKFIGDITYYIINISNLSFAFAIFITTSVVILFNKREYLFSGISNRSHEDNSIFFLLFLIVFYLVSLIITLGVLIFTGNWVDKGNIRYIQPLYFLPLFFLALILVVYNDKKTFWLKLIIFSTIAIFSLHQIIPEAITLEAANLKLPYPEMVQCLDKLAINYDLKYGYSDYWNAKYTTIMSHSGARVNELDTDLHILNWINNPAWYINKVGEDSEQYPKYQFILTERLSKSEIETRFGKPAIRKQCPGTEIYIYNRKSDVAFRNFLRVPTTIAANASMPSSILSPKNLRKYAHNGKSWNERGNVIIPKNGELSVKLDPPVVSEIIEIAADNNDEYVIDFFRDEIILGQLAVPRMPEQGIQARYLPLPKSILGRQFNRLVIRPLQGDGLYSVGDIFFYNDSLK